MASSVGTSRTVKPGTSGWERLILTGYRATGKTSIGRRLADIFGCGFVDTDELVIDRAGCGIRELVAKRGWECFRELERQVLADLSDRAGLVIATGGGAILHEEVWRSLRKRSIVCWLKAEPATILKRLKRDLNSVENRPPLSDMEPDKEIRAQLARREPLYRRGADFAMKTDAKTPGTIALEIAHRARAWPGCGEGGQDNGR